MKLFNKILLGAAAISVMGAFSSCKEEATLSGAEAVYIEMANTNFSMVVGDTVKLEARVSNVAGKDINTPIEWSVGDTNVLEIVDIVETKRELNPNYQPSENNDTERPGSPSDDEGTDESDNTTASTADDDTEPAEPVNTTDRYIQVDYHYVGVTPVKGSQGKTTTIRASLENGQFAITQVTVDRNAVAGCITPELEEDVSYNDYKNDVLWFDVDPIAVVDDYDVSFTIDMLEVLTPADLIPAGEDTFTYPDPDFTLGVMHDDPDGGDAVEVRLPVNNGIVIDRELKRVGVVFTAPRLAGKSKVTLTIGNADESASASTTLYLFPRISGGLKYEKNGETLYPNFSDKNPSNEKPRLVSVTMDVNSSYYVACCMGINSGRDIDIQNAILAEEAGYFTWTIEGSYVVIEDQFTSTEKLDGETYTSGYISYLKVRSGVGQGTARCTFTFPGPSVDTDDTDNVFITDVAVVNFNETYPVEEIVVATEDNPNVSDGGTIEAFIGQTLTLDVSVQPDASFSYHIPEITSSDPTILEVVERGSDDGYSRRFTPLQPGEVTLTFTSLDKVKRVNVVVKDRVHALAWGIAPNANMPMSTSEDVKVNITMASNVNTPVSTYDGTVTWKSSNPSVVSVTPKANQIYCTLTTLSEGTAVITATLDSGESVSKEVTVEALSAIIFDESSTCEAYMEDPYLMIYTEDEDGNFYYFGIPMTEFNVGTYVGTDGAIETNDYSVEGAVYDITIADADGAYMVTGTITHSNGASFTFNSATFETVEE